MAALIATQPSDSIGDFISFVVNLFGRDVYATRRGTTSAQVATLAAYCPYQLPKLYLDYLGEFGADAGGFDLGRGTESNIETLLAFNEEGMDPQFPDVPEKCFVFALGDEGGRAFDFSACEALSANEPKIVRYYEASIDYHVARTFRNYLFTEAFLQARFPRDVLCTCRLTSKQRCRMQDLTDATMRFGFRPYWFSDECRSCLERDGTSLVITSGNDFTIVAGAAAEGATIADVKSHLLQTFPLREYGL